MRATVLTRTQGMSRSEWLRWRRRGLGGSDMAAIMGLSPFASPLEVFRAKIREASADDASEAMYWGTQLEDVVAREFARRTGFKVHRRQALLQHPTVPYLIGNVDRIVTSHPGGPAVLEAKTTSAFRQESWAEGAAPLAYQVQVQHYLDLTGYAQGYLAVLIGGQDFRIVPVPRDAELIARMHEAAEAFWLCVQTGTPPTVDGSAATAEALKLLYDRANGREILLPDEAWAWIDQRAQAKAAEKAAQAALTEAENHLKALLGEAERGQLPGYLVTWSNRTRKHFDTAALIRDHPEWAEVYSSPTSYRTLTVQERK